MRSKPKRRLNLRVAVAYFALLALTLLAIVIGPTSGSPISPINDPNAVNEPVIDPQSHLFETHINTQGQTVVNSGPTGVFDYMIQNAWTTLGGLNVGADPNDFSGPEILVQPNFPLTLTLTHTQFSCPPTAPSPCSGQEQFGDTLGHNLLPGGTLGGVFSGNLVGGNVTGFISLFIQQAGGGTVQSARTFILSTPGPFSVTMPSVTIPAPSNPSNTDWDTTFTIGFSNMTAGTTIILPDSLSETIRGPTAPAPEPGSAILAAAIAGLIALRRRLYHPP